MIESRHVPCVTFVDEVSRKTRAQALTRYLVRMAVLRILRTTRRAMRELRARWTTDLGEVEDPGTQGEVEKVWLLPATHRAYDLRPKR